VIEFKKADASAWPPLDTQRSGDQLVATLNDEGLPDGVYDVRARALDQAGNETSTETRTDGSAAMVTLPLRLETHLPLARFIGCSAATAADAPYRLGGCGSAGA
jgi:hypothetical protein